jgi:structural maintenance of chromosome 4
LGSHLSSLAFCNGRFVAQDVADRLGKHGVDLDNNRFLILQGEVEQIAMMKPKAGPGQDGEFG